MGFKIAAAFTLASASLVNAWGNVGHQTVGYIAQNFISSSTASWAKGLLSDSSDSYLATAATWADTYKYTSAGAFSKPFHYIDAMDNPPSSCSVDYDRDCDGGCSVSAIVNYTQRVQDGRLTAAHKEEALRFLVHFLGDITQPLHDENLEVGGNDIDVTFNGESTNLHSCWDTNFIEKYLGGSTISTAKSWSNTLTTAIKSGQYSSQAKSWISSSTLSDVKGSAMSWASDGNAAVCSYVLKGGESSVENKDLDGTYYENAMPVIELQIAKGGYRLAAWLNLINDGTTGL